jgi:dihydropteroate synthase
VAVRRPYHVRVAGGRSLELGARTLVMGILNVTPDSFADGGLYSEPGQAIDAALAMVEAGADLIDVGGESTRPGAAAVDANEELRRVLPVVRGIVAQSPVPVSVDTYKAVVADATLDAGAALVNDISGLQYDPALAPVVASYDAGLILMHTRGRSSEMYALSNYADVVLEVAGELTASVAAAVAAGVPRDALIIDLGVGFAKRPEHSYAVLTAADHPAIAAIDRPVLSGPSRKSFLQSALGECPPGERVWGTAAAVTAAVVSGAHIVRVHDVKEMVQVVRVADKIRALRWTNSPT